MAVAYMLGLGAWRMRGGSTQDSVLPLAFREMRWQLVDHNGRGVRPQDWLGRPAMVFFGFTWCPDATTVSNGVCRHRADVWFAWCAKPFC